MPDSINLREKFSLFQDHWSPKIVGELNDFHVKVVKLQGEFVWHKHDDTDELFWVVDGSFVMQFRDKNVTLHAGEFIIVPKDVEHCPLAEEEAHVVLIERKGTLNTGDAQDSDKTVTQLETI